MKKSLTLAFTVVVFGLIAIEGSAAGVINWTPYPLPPVGNIIGQFNDVIFDGTQFWAVGANGWVQKSPDGVTWTSVAPGPTYFFYDIAYGGGNQYVVVGAGSGGAGSSVYVTNDGGATWSQSTTGVPGFFSLYNVAHGATAGEYVAVGSGGTIVRSTDGGVTWSPPANYSPSPYGLNSVIYTPIGTGLYVAVGGNGIILTSNNGGNTWTPQNSGTTVVLENVAYANGLLVAVGWNGTILTSPNGVNWTQVTPAPTTKNLTAVTYGPCGWVVAGVQGTVLSSPNGTSWTAETSNTTAPLIGAAYGNNRYVVVGQGTTLVGQCQGQTGGGCVPPPPDMVAWYPLDEQAGATTVQDIAPAPFSTINDWGSTQPGPVHSGGPMAVVGKVGAGALYFFGPHIQVPHSADLNFPSGLSIDAWIRVVDCGHGSGGAWAPIVDKWDPATQTGFSFFVDQPAPATGFLKLQLNSALFTSTHSLPTSANPVANVGPWVHVAVTVDPTSNLGVFYINGAVAGGVCASSRRNRQCFADVDRRDAPARRPL